MNTLADVYIDLSVNSFMIVFYYQCNMMQGQSFCSQGGCLLLVSGRHPPRQTPPRQTPPGRHLPGQTTIGQTPPPPGRHPTSGQTPLGRHPWADIPHLGDTPLRSACWDTVNKRAVRIPVEYILVKSFLEDFFFQRLD